MLLALLNELRIKKLYLTRRLVMSSTEKYFGFVEKERGLNELEVNPCDLLNFARLYLGSSKSYATHSRDQEIVIVILGGTCNIKIANKTFENIGKRKNVFQGAPYAVYVPCNHRVEIKSNEDCELEAAICYASSNLQTEPYLILPQEVIKGKWGASNFSRTYHKILTEESNRPAQRLIVGETYTPSGNWSTFPPHKHEVDNLPEEAYMEEIYFFKVDPVEGFGLAKHYTDDRSIDSVYTVKNDAILLMPKGYHTVVSAPGYITYYLWVLAGNHRRQAPVADPSLRWVSKTTSIIKNIEDNLSV
jgi:5-deoxy-glucuronate isomerase